MVWNALAVFILFVGSILLNVCLGEVRLSPNQALDLLLGDGAINSSLREMIWEIRLPRVACAALVGAALATSGYLLQSLSRNYLADPYLTGVSSGAGLAIALSMIAGVDFAILPIVALVGGMVSSFLVAGMAKTPTGISVTKLLLGGVAVSAVCGSLMTLLMTTFASGARAQGLYFWLAGSLGGRGWLEFRPAAFYVGTAIVAAFVLSKQLRLLALGSQSARSLGVDVGLMQGLILATAVVLCGTSVSLAGIVGFVGLIAPYISRRLFGTDERVHLIACICVGATLVLLSDLCARTVAPGQELPLSTLLSLVGAPFFLWLVLKHRGEA